MQQSDHRKRQVGFVSIYGIVLGRGILATSIAMARSAKCLKKPENCNTRLTVKDAGEAMKSFFICRPFANLSQ
jgi:hypothetical protein